jgi:hypothetical protein
MVTRRAVGPEQQVRSLCAASSPPVVPRWGSGSPPGCLPGNTGSNPVRGVANITSTALGQWKPAWLSPRKHGFEPRTWCPSAPLCRVGAVEARLVVSQETRVRTPYVASQASPVPRWGSGSPPGCLPGNTGSNPVRGVLITGPIAQPVERRILNPQAPSSSLGRLVPPPYTPHPQTGPIAQLVERRLFTPQAPSSSLGRLSPHPSTHEPGPIAQLVERRILNPQAPSSSLGRLVPTLTNNPSRTTRAGSSAGRAADS